MNHSNNYFQKGVVILVVTMLLAIPNMQVYSSVGSYRLLSQAVNANNYYNIHTEKKDFRNLPAIASVALTGGIIIVSLAVSASIATTGFGMMDDGHGVFSGYGNIINPALEPNPLNKNYAKHNFSEFDNS